MVTQPASAAATLFNYKLFLNIYILHLPLFCEGAGVILNHISPNMSWSLVSFSNNWQHLIIVTWTPCHQGWLHCLLRQFLIFQGSKICSLSPLPQTKVCRNHISRTFKCSRPFPYHLTTPVQVFPLFIFPRYVFFGAWSLQRPHLVSWPTWLGKKVHSIHSLSVYILLFISGISMH